MCCMTTEQGDCKGDYPREREYRDTYLKNLKSGRLLLIMPFLNPKKQYIIEFCQFNHENVSQIPQNVPNANEYKGALEP